MKGPTFVKLPIIWRTLFIAKMMSDQKAFRPKSFLAGADLMPLLLATFHFIKLSEADNFLFTHPPTPSLRRSLLVLGRES